MKLLLFSDSHGNAKYLRAMQKRLLAEGQPDAILFAGDGAHDTALLSVACPVYSVRGNCDLTAIAPLEMVIPLGPWRIYLSHGHLHRVKQTLDLLASAARAGDARIAVYGHTHRQGLDLVNGVYCLNPGALDKGQYAWLTLDSGAVRPVFASL